MPTDETTGEIMDAILKEWSDKVITQLQQSIHKAGLELTDDLLNSLRNEVIPGGYRELARVSFYFRTHGRFKDMKTTYTKFTGGWHPKGFAPVDVIEEFIKKVGLQKFKYIPGYRQGTFPTETRAIRRLAWGIAIGMAKRGTTKPNKWYAKTFYSTINKLMESAGEALSKKTATTIKETLE